MVVVLDAAEQQAHMPPGQPARRRLEPDPAALPPGPLVQAQDLVAVLPSVAVVFRAGVVERVFDHLA